MTEVRVMLGGGMGFELFETEQLPDAVGVRCCLEDGIARTTTILGGGGE